MSIILLKIPISEFVESENFIYLQHLADKICILKKIQTCVMVQVHTRGSGRDKLAPASAAHGVHRLYEANTIS